ncbi:MAG: hypothetical protein LBJ03_01980 [Holosporales bacterium]|jgi:SAM-dependent methyltransferase|nr:hypothetical protein [Holosporales bacterium]
MLRKIPKSLLLILSVLSTGSAYSALYMAFHPGNRPTLPSSELLSGTNFAGMRHYLDHLTFRQNKIRDLASGIGISTLSLPATLIVGNGRRHELDVINYGEYTYDYLLMDVDESVGPDLKCDVSRLQQFAVEHDMIDKFDVVVFENIPVRSSFTSEAVAGALTCLKPNGHLVISSFPIPGARVYAADDLSPITALNTVTVELGDYTWFRNKEFQDRRQIIKTKNLGLGDRLTDISPFEQIAAFLNEHKGKIIDYFDDHVKLQIGELEVTTVPYTSRLWPQGPRIWSDLFEPENKGVMIITKK